MFAYIDPGSGSLIFQVLIAGMMGGMFLFRKTFLIPIKSFFRFLKKNNKTPNE